ncbi:unnamed protein product [Cuscuta epithymum]|uniref:Uncharacterized protein n=1 Tax=Cuscuta epithymum TaxID=186058 RepID=A0AAV0G1N0_9ASTE|nr:unnamed protein product [Cuscuta epithymum]CAH9141836.1 unnamed protein product [Cuscuta epithymum]
MEVVRSALDIAYQKAVEPKDRPIHFLHACSQFYEFAMILVDVGCNVVRRDTYVPNERSQKEIVLSDLLKIAQVLYERIEVIQTSINDEKDEDRSKDNGNELYHNQIQRMSCDLDMLKNTFGGFVFGQSGDKETKILESELQLDIHKVIMSEMMNSLKMEKCDYEIQNMIREEIHAFVITEVVKHSASDHSKEDEIPPLPSSARKWENNEEENLIQVLDSVLRCLEMEEDLVVSASSEIEQHSVNHYLEIFRTEEREEREAIQWLLDSDESILSSVNIKLAKALKQLLTSKELLLDLEQGLGLYPDGEGDDKDNNNNVDEDERLSSCRLSDGNPFSSLRRFQKVLTDFEDTVLASLEKKCLRIEKLEQQLEELEHPVVSLKRREQLYKKAFIARCHSLHFAENEVDLLGDQVESLLQFLGKIYRKLSKYSSSCHFEVSDIVRLIKKEIADTVVCTQN